VPSIYLHSIYSACMMRTAALLSEVVPAKSLPLRTSESVDDYLKAILELGGTEELRVTTNALAERLAVRTPSVTGMLQRLALERPSLVLYESTGVFGSLLSGSGGPGNWYDITACSNYSSMMF